MGSTSSHTGLGTVNYGYDSNHNKVREEWGDNDVLHPWSFYTSETNTLTTDEADGYDAEDRFTRFRRPGLSGGQQTVNFVRGIATDSNGSIGNISSISVENNSAHNRVILGDRLYNDTHGFTADAANSPAVTQAFDVDGFLTNAHNGNSYNWENASGRLLSATVPANSDNRIAGTHSYGYEAMGRRAWKKVSGSGETILYVYAGPNCIAEYSIVDSTATLQQEVVYADRIDSQVLLSRNDDTERYHFLTGQQWSVLALADANNNGNIVELYAYDAFGSRFVLSAAGVLQPSGTTRDNAYGFTGRRFDDETGLMYYRNRCYDSRAGNFISRDPYEYVDGMSMYPFYPGFTGVDPWGLEIKFNGDDEDVKKAKELVEKLKKSSECYGEERN